MDTEAGTEFNQDDIKNALIEFAFQKNMIVDSAPWKAITLDMLLPYLDQTLWGDISVNQAKCGPYTQLDKAREVLTKWLNATTFMEQELKTYQAQEESLNHE